MSPYRKEWEESFVLKFFTGNGRTPHQEKSKNGEDHKIGDAQGTPLDSY
jgi:hypothetical protein